MNWIDGFLLGLGTYLAVIFLVRMMRHRQEQGLVELRRRLKAEEQRKQKQPM